MPADGLDAAARDSHVATDAAAATTPRNCVALAPATSLALIAYAPPLHAALGLTRTRAWSRSRSSTAAARRARRSVDDLPFEVQLRVATFADAKSLAALAQTCAAMRAVATVDALWYPLLLKDWGCRPGDFRDPRPTARKLYRYLERSWRRLFFGSARDAWDADRRRLIS